MRVLIVGATGFCGRALTARLAIDPAYHVTAHIRPESSRSVAAIKAWDELGVSHLSCAWDDLPAHLEASPPAVVISCLGITKRGARTHGGSYASVDSGLNLMLIETARALKAPPLFVYISSMGVEWGRWSAYLQARADVESALRSGGLPHIIVRPGLLAGPSRDETRPLEALGAWISYFIAGLVERCGLRSLAWRSRPLDAPEIAEVITALIETHALDSSSARVCELSELHRIRHERLE